MRKSKNPNLNKLQSVKSEIEEKCSFEKGVSKSPLLFVSMIKCEDCGHPHTTTYQQRKYTAKVERLH